MIDYNATILVVDDDKNHRTMLKLNLRKAGFKVIEVSDGEEVIPVLKKKSVDVILLDLKMKRMGGLTTLSALQQAGITLPVVVITAFSSVESAVKAMKRGAFDYITKPVDIQELKLTLSRALSYKSSTENDNNRNKSWMVVTILATSLEKVQL